MARNIQNSKLWPIVFNQKSIKTNKSNESACWSHNLVVNIVVHIQAKYRKDRMTTEGAYGQKSPKFTIFVIENPLKNRSKNSKFLFLRFLPSIVLHIHAKYRKDRMKISGAYSIWKKKLTTDGRRTMDDGRPGIR